MTSTTSSSAPSLTRLRDWRLLWSGGAAGALGANISIFALPLFVHAETGSVALAGATAASGLLGGLITQVFAGAFIDRHQLRTALVGVSLTRALVWLTAFAIAALLPGTAWWLLLIAYVFGLSTQSLITAASGAAVRQLVPAAMRTAASGQNQARQAGARLLGPPIGAALFGFQPWLPFMAEAVLFVIGALVLHRLSAQKLHRQLEAGTKKITGFARMVVDGYRLCFANGLLRSVIVFGLLGNFALIAIYQSVTLRLVASGKESWTVAAVGMTIGAATLLSALLVTHTNKLLPGRSLILASLMVFLFGALGVALIDQVSIVAIAGCGLIACSLPAITAQVFSRLSTEIPAGMQGRAMSAAALSSTLLTPIAPLAASEVFIGLDAWIGALTCAAAFAFALGALWFAPEEAL